MTKQKSILLILLFSLLSSLPGCTYGFLYTDITEPLTTNMQNTPVGEETTEVGINIISEPATGTGISAEIGSTAIGDAAKRAGLTKIYFADIRTVSILGGLIEQRTVLVSGE